MRLHLKQKYTIQYISENKKENECTKDKEINERKKNKKMGERGLGGGGRVVINN